jgi:hypothetical protein
MSFHVSNDQKKQDNEKEKENAGSKTATPVQVPVTQGDDFCAELVDGVMDFSHIKDEQFIVAVSTGDRNKQKLLASTIRGPYTFSEMCNRVGRMWEEHAHHAKVYVLEQDPTKPTTFLDAGTVDYIEANWEDIVFREEFEVILDDEYEIIPAGTIGTEKGND